MATSDNQQTFDLLLKCALCNGDFNKNNQPKSLPCLHTFCSPCLTNERQSFVKDNNIFKCPVCHTRVKQSPEDPEITNNLKLDVIIEKLLHVRQLQQSERHCEMCTDKDEVSKQWCLDCGMFLCDSCLLHHKKYKPHDKVIDISQGSNFDNVGDFILPTKCSDHGEKLNTFCRQCKICLCLRCSIDHKANENLDCVPVSIEKVAPNTKAQGRQLLQEISSHLEKEKQQIKDMKLRNEDLRKQCSEKCTEIWDHLVKTMERLKENARTLTMELEAATKSKIDESEKLIQIRQDKVEEIEIINKNIQELLQSFDNVDIVLNFSRLKSKFENSWIDPNDFLIDLHKINVLYNTWYLKTHELSETVPMGHCWWDSRYLPTLFGNLHQEQASSIPLQFFLQTPVPYLDIKKSETIDDFLLGLSCIFVIDKNHVLVGCGASGMLHEYNGRSALRKNYKQKIHNIMQMKYCYDICQFSSDKMCIVDSRLIFLQINKNAPSMTYLKCIEPDVGYYSICNCYGKILVCDFYCRVHLLDEEGNVQRTILNIKREPSADHIIRCGSFRDTFLLYNGVEQKLSCHSLDGTACLFSVNVGNVRDLCTDKYGNIYVAGVHHIYVLSPDTSVRCIIDSFEHFCIFIKDDIFYLGAYTGMFELKTYCLLYHDQSSN